jgi:DNA-binding CsgD family transcriptional regulator
LGRAAEITRVLDVVSRLECGLGGVVLVEGQAGIGKTTLLEAVLTEVGARGHRVWRGAGNELDQDLPFDLVAQALQLHPTSADPEAARIGRLLLGDPSEATMPSSFTGIRFRLVEAIVSLIERLTSAGPAVLALEDLHWADSSTLLAVGHLGRRLPDRPFMLLGTFRPTPGSAVLNRLVTELTGHEGGVHLVLGPLDGSAVHALVERMVQAPPSPELLAMTAVAGGNPLFVTEAVRVLQAEGMLGPADGSANLADRVMSPSFSSLVLRQIACLPASVLQVLRVATVLGNSFPVVDLATVLGRSPSDLLEVLDEALRVGVLQDDGACLVFRHELVREAVYLDLPPAVRRGLHLQAARALGAAGASAVQVAPHFARGASPGDASAVEWLWRAGTQIASRDPKSATELLEHAFHLTRPGDPRRLGITAELVDALIWSGRHSEAIERARDLLRRDHDAQRRRRVRHAVARALLTVGRSADAKAEIDAAPVAGDDHDPRLEADAALAQVFSGEPVSGRSAAERALARAERLGDVEAYQYANSVICVASLQIGEIQQAIIAGQRAIDAADAAASAAHGYGAHLFLGTALMEADRLDESFPILTDGLRIADEFGTIQLSIFFHSQIGLHRFYTGQWDDAVADFQTASLLAQENIGAPVTFAEAIMAVIEVHRGSVARAEEHATRAQRAVAAGHQMGADAVLWAVALVQEARGDADAALQTLESAWQLNLTMGFRIQNIRPALDLVRLSLARGRRDLAGAVAAELEELATLNPTVTLTCRARLCRGLAETDLDVVRSAASTGPASGRVAERAWARLEAGLALAEAKQQDEAIGLLVESKADSERLGAGRDVARAESALRGLGAPPGRRGPHRRASTGWASLTKTELDIVWLAAEGLTNAQIGARLFKSGRTVESHFAHIFAKLGVSSRIQVVAEAAKRRSTRG